MCDEILVDEFVIFFIRRVYILSGSGQVALSTSVQLGPFAKFFRLKNFPYLALANNFRVFKINLGSISDLALCCFTFLIFLSSVTML